jgi:hypothetical protein
MKLTENINEDEAALTRALAVLREVTQALHKGISTEQFDQRFRGKFVSPGVPVRQYVRQLRISGSLVETNGIMKMKQATSYNTTP